MRQVLYGRNAVRESLRAGRRKPYRLMLAEGVRQTGTVGEILFLAEKAGLPVSRTERRDLDRLGSVNHQGIVLETSEYPYGEFDDVLTVARSRDQAPLFLSLIHI